MKKVLLSIGLALCVFSASAQETREARVFTPQAGDFSISVDATPFLNYAGNIFGSHATAPTFEIGTIRGRYFLSERNAIRATLGFDFRTTMNRNDVPEVGNADNNVTNVTRQSNNLFSLGVGYEFRRGTGRLQAFYGAEVLFVAGGSSTNHTWGNNLSANNTNGGIARTTQHRGGTTIGAGLGGFVGVDYFITSRIALGAEVGLSMVYSNHGRGQTTTERWTGSAVETTTTDGTSSFGAFNFRTNAMSGGNIFISFFF